MKVINKKSNFGLKTISAFKYVRAEVESFIETGEKPVNALLLIPIELLKVEYRIFDISKASFFCDEYVSLNELDSLVLDIYNSFQDNSALWINELTDYDLKIRLLKIRSAMYVSGVLTLVKDNSKS